MLVIVEDANDNGYFDFRKPNGEASHSFQSGQLNDVVLTMQLLINTVPYMACGNCHICD